MTAHSGSRAHSSIFHNAPNALIGLLLLALLLRGTTLHIRRLADTEFAQIILKYVHKCRPI